MSQLQLFRMREPAALLVTLVTLLTLASCRDPRAEANIAQAMTEVGTTINALQQDFGILQWQVDSLREVIARQDTIIVRLASHVGLPIASR